MKSTTILRIIGLLKEPQFIIFLLIAFGMWNLNRLNSVYVNDIEVPVTIDGTQNPNSNKKDNNKFNVVCKVRGNGYTILLMHLFPRFKAVEISAADVKMVPSQDSTYYTINIISLEKAISQKLATVELQAILNNDIKIDAVNYAEKNVPIEANLSLNVKGQYMQVGNSILTPAYVTIKGKAETVKNITKVSTEPIIITSDDTEPAGTIKLQKIPDIIYSVKSVSYAIDIEQYTEVIIDANVSVRVDSIKSVNPNEYTILPQKVKAVVNVAESKYKDFDQSKVDLYVDFNPNSEVKGSTDYLGNNKFKVKIDGLPIGIEKVIISPAYVTILKNSKK